MGKHQGEVKQRLGGDVMRWILDDVISHDITGQHMKEIAYQLDTVNKAIRGKHEWRMEQPSTTLDHAGRAVNEMMQILEDWWTVGDLGELSMKNALKRLVDILREKNISLKPLAKKIEKKMESCGMVVENLNDSTNKILLLVGKTGSGKSSLCNKIAGEDPNCDMFPVSSGPTSCTQNITMANVSFLGDDNRPVSVIDTNGFDDAKDVADINTTQNLVDELKKRAKFVNLIGLTVNGESPRLDASLVTTLRILEEMFGKFFWEHCVLIFTKLSMDKKAQERRWKHNNKDDNTVAGEYVDEIRKEFPQCKKLPVMFLEAWCDEKEEEEGAIFMQNMDELYNQLMSSDALPTSKINEDASSEYAKMKAELEEVHKTLEEAHELMEEAQKQFDTELQTLRAENNNTLMGEQVLGLEHLLQKDRDSLIDFKGEIKLLTDPSTYTSVVTSHLKKPNKSVMYWLPKTFERVEGSGHALFTIKKERAVITCTILALNSKVSKTQNSLRLSMKKLDIVEERICDTVLEDTKRLLRSLSISDKSDARINIEALNSEYVLCFCVKHGFLPDDSFDRTLSDDNLIPMTLTVELEELEERESGTKRVLYKGTNWKGNKYLTFSDGTFSYMNTERTAEGPTVANVYHSGRPGECAKIGYVPYEKRKPMETECDIDSDDSGDPGNFGDSEGFSLKKRRKFN